MAEISSINFVNGSQPDQDQLNDPQRIGSADLAEVFRSLLHDGEAVPDGGLVANGFDVAGKAGDMRVDVGPGVGFAENPSYSSPQSTFALALSRATVQSAALSNGDATNDRIDLISVQPISGLLDEELVNQKGAPAANQATRRGPDMNVVITEGTPAASPVPPALPSNQGLILVAHVLIPAGLTAGGGGTASATITDAKNRVSNSLKGYNASTFGWRQEVDSWSSNIVMAQVEGVLDEVGKILNLFADCGDHWPAFSRVGEPTGDETGNLYPMVTIDDRTWWETAPGGQSAGDVSDSDVTIERQGLWHSPDQYIGTRVYHATGNAATKYISIEFQAAARALAPQAFKVNYRVATILGGAGTVKAEAFRYKASDGTVESLSDEVTLANTVDTNHTTTLTTPVEKTLDEGDIVAIRFTCDFAASADAAAVHLRSARVQWMEGRDVS